MCPYARMCAGLWLHMQRDYCESHEILIGVPSVSIYHNGASLTFTRPGWQPTTHVAAQLNPTRIQVRA